MTVTKVFIKQVASRSAHDSGIYGLAYSDRRTELQINGRENFNLVKAINYLEVFNGNIVRAFNVGSGLGSTGIQIELINDGDKGASLAKYLRNGIPELTKTIKANPSLAGYQEINF